jgi:predicted O-methyltransferase YrrM
VTHLTQTAKALQFLTLAVRSPAEAYDRLFTKIDAVQEGSSGKPPVYIPTGYAAAISGLLEQFPGLDSCAEESGLREIEAQVRSKLASMPAEAPFRLSHNADFTLARCCYLACRLLKPEIAVETGVCYGLATAFLLAAMRANGRGRLYSIDLPPLGVDADKWVGILIPPELRDRWQLIRGSSKRELPKLAGSLGKIDFFFHDSLHTHKNITFELNTIGARLSPRAIVIADDVDGTHAFANWIAATSPAFSAIVQEADKPSMFGISVHGSRAE